jgi:hypothetical protein
MHENVNNTTSGSPPSIQQLVQNKELTKEETRRQVDLTKYKKLIKEETRRRVAQRTNLIYALQRLEYDTSRDALDEAAGTLADYWQSICCEEFSEDEFMFLRKWQGELLRNYVSDRVERDNFADSKAREKEAERYLAFLFNIRLLKEEPRKSLQSVSSRQLKLLLFVGREEVKKYDAYLRYVDRTHGVQESGESKHLEDYALATNDVEKAFELLVT